MRILTPTKKDIITSAIEDYLKQILVLSDTKGYAQVTEIANSLQVSKASVNEMVNKLKDFGFVNHQKYGTISLTDEGIELAKKVKRRHDLLHTFLLLIGVNDENASIDCCIMEHNLSVATNEKLMNFIIFLKDEKQNYIFERFAEFIKQK